MRRAGLPATAALLALGGCGYTFGTGLPERGIRSVALTLVANQTWRQRLEVELAAALARELPITTDLRLARAADADALVEVAIVETAERTLVPGPRTAPTLEGALAAAVRMRLLDRGGGVLLERVLLDRTEFRDPVGEDLASARVELAADLARKIALEIGNR